MYQGEKKAVHGVYTFSDIHQTSPEVGGHTLLLHVALIHRNGGLKFCVP